MAPADADRLAAEAWVQLVQRLDAFDGDEHAFLALGFAIARRRANETGDRRDGATGSADAEPVIDLTLAEYVDDDGMAGLGVRSALAAISRLPRDQADLILLRVLGELSVYEVATLLDRPVEVVGTLQLEALQTLNWVTTTTGAVP